MKLTSTLLLFSCFFVSLQAQDSTFLANTKHEIAIASSVYVTPLLGLQGNASFRPLFLYKHKIATNKLIRAGILGRNEQTISDEPTKIIIKDTMMQTFYTQDNNTSARFHVGLEKQFLFKHNQRFRASYGCDAIFELNTKKEQLNGYRYLKENGAYVLNDNFFAEDFILLQDEKSYAAGISPFFSLDYRILKRLYLGGVVNSIVSYNFTSGSIDFNMVYVPTISFRF
jgi:hypothetical protein